jgi:RNA polymerase sigma-70 factor (ECF subfamily)
VNPVTDDDLLARCRAEPEALGEVYERHAASVHRYLSRRVGAAAADDLLGDVFLAALGVRHRVRPHASGSALPWLYGIASNTVRAHHRRRQGGSPIAAEPAELVDWDAVDARLDAQSRDGDLKLALAALTPAERELLLLVAWEGLSPAEAGAALEINPVAARSRLHRARTRAQAALDALSAADR